LNIKPTLDARATALLKTELKGKKNADPTRYAISYNQMSVIDPDAGYSVGNPVTVKIGVGAEIPKGPDEAPYVEATMTVLLETSREKISAKVLKAESAKK
jgi:PhoPQ-activated pathogenicity-related protein